MQRSHNFTLIVLLLATAGPGHAQAPPDAPPAATVAPASANPCGPLRPGQPSGTMAPDGRTTGQSGAPLSDQLAKSDGVLCPPAGIDPEMRAPTPDAGNTPVIPPPGSPGGDPTIRPK
jgi:hypothetical protein